MSDTLSNAALEKLVEKLEDRVADLEKTVHDQEVTSAVQASNLKDVKRAVGFSIAALAGGVLIGLMDAIIR